MTVFYTADLHFGHQRIQEFVPWRPGADVDEMNQVLIERWNETVTLQDDVIVLGDVAMGKIADTLPLVGQLNGSKVLLPGNHDRCFEGLKGWEKWVQRYLDVGFNDIVQGTGTNCLGEKMVVKLNHFPYTKDERHEDRFDEWLPHNDHKTWLLHGHVHQLWKTQRAHMQINVGVDVWDYRPVSAEQLLAEITPPRTEEPAK